MPTCMVVLILVHSSNQISHGQELEHVQQKYLHVSAKLEQKVTQLQVLTNSRTIDALCLYREIHTHLQKKAPTKSIYS